MKNFFNTFAGIGLILSSTSFGQIQNSTLSARHQQKIIQSIYEKCHLSPLLTQLSSESEIVIVDNGIRDEYFSTTLKGVVGIDQYAVDKYYISVQSVIFDHFDHQAQEWGGIEIKNVKCQEVTDQF